MKSPKRLERKPDRLVPNVVLILFSVTSVRFTCLSAIDSYGACKILFNRTNAPAARAEEEYTPYPMYFKLRREGKEARGNRTTCYRSGPMILSVISLGKTALQERQAYALVVHNYDRSGKLLDSRPATRFGHKIVDFAYAGIMVLADGGT